MSGARVLVTCYPQSGHLHPLIPIAGGLADAGCAVLVATSSAQHGVLAAAGLRAVDLGPSHEDTTAQLATALPAMRALPPADRRPHGFGMLFGETYAASIADELFTIAQAWQPDLILAGVESLAGPLVAARLDLPLVVNGFGIGLPNDVCDAAARAVAPLWRRAGLSTPPRAGIFDGLFVDPCPPSLRPADVPIAHDVRSVRPAQFDGAGDLPPLPARRPLVYVTFGTNRVFATPTRLRTIAEAIAGFGAGAVITGCDPEELGALPDGTAAYRFVPQSLLLSHCDAVICHAGASTLFGALAKGLPLLLTPLGADHFANATATVRRGAALTLDGDGDAASIATLLDRLLAEHSFRRAAIEVAEEIAAMPSPAATVQEVLAWLARRPDRHV